MTTDKSDQPLHLTINDLTGLDRAWWFFHHVNTFYIGKPIVQVSKFIYLGHKLSATNDGTAAVKHRIGLGWAAFEKNKEILTSKRVPYNIKAKVYNTYVLPVVLYGLECVNWTSKLCMTVENLQNHIIRFMTKP